MSPTGPSDKIYVTNRTKNKLLTLTTDGTLISTFTDPELSSPQAVHVTPSEQVLVCGNYSNTLRWIVMEEKNWQLWLHRKMD
ncbi:hypothetical protein DPMN_145371 [Dreissena polymorpha]|uniref:Uncharacterized protein n=1 Tax=Dreissena polymorpha TaxID=45954 RepID=A0A9D4F8G6_DREPO|nr:hypothetical protein DPMN_145371 [Dreissena polymorpha]